MSILKRLSALLLAVLMVFTITGMQAAEHAETIPVKATVWAEMDQDLLAQTIGFAAGEEGLTRDVAQALAGALTKARLQVAYNGDNVGLTLGSDKGDVLSLFYTVLLNQGLVYMETDLFPGFVLQTTAEVNEGSVSPEKFQEITRSVTDKLSSADIEAWLKPYAEDITAYWDKNMAHSLSYEEGSYTMPDGSVWPVKGTFRLVEGEFAGLIKLIFERLDKDQAFKDFTQEWLDTIEKMNNASGTPEESPKLDAFFEEGRQIMTEAPLDSEELFTTITFYTDAEHRDVFTTLRLENGQYFMLSLSGDEPRKVSFVYLQASTYIEGAYSDSGSDTVNAQLGSQAPAAENGQGTLQVQPSLEEMTTLYQGVLNKSIDYDSMVQVDLSVKGTDKMEGMELSFAYHTPYEGSQNVHLTMNTLSDTPWKIEGKLTSNMLEETAADLPTLPREGTTIIAITQDGDIDEEAMMAAANAFAKEGLPALYQRLQNAFPEEADILSALLQQGIGEPLDELMEEAEVTP